LGHRESDTITAEELISEFLVQGECYLHFNHYL
jgi:hypothetical protein